MASNVRALDRAEIPRVGDEKPGRAETEAAFRTILRWTGTIPAAKV